MRKKILLALFISILATSSYAELTCPIRPGYVVCSSGKAPHVVLSHVPAEWKADAAVDPDDCLDSRAYLFKFSTVSYYTADFINRKKGTMECDYLSEDQYGFIRASLSLFSMNYLPAVNAPYNDWEGVTGGQDCGFMDGTSIFNCPLGIKPE